MGKKQGDEPKLWVTVIKLVLGLAVIVGGVGLALWYASQREQADAPLAAPTTGWGIANDSPLHKKR